MKRLTVVLVVLLVAAPMVLAQVVQPIAFGGTQVGVGARAAALGGAYTAVSDDAYALYYNPAGLNLIPKGEINVNAGVVGVTNGIAVANDLSRLVGILGSGDVSVDDFLFIRDLAVKDDERAGQINTGEASGFAGIATKNAALGWYGLGSGAVDLDYYGWSGCGEEVWAQGGALWQTSYGAALAMALNSQCSVGVTLRSTRLAYTMVDWEADWYEGDNDVRVWNYNESGHDTKVAADLGFMWRPEDRVRFGVMVRNVSAPKFTVTDGCCERSMTADPSVDFGLAVFSPDGRQALVADVHNATGNNDIRSTVHLGYEAQVNRSLTLRVGGSDYGLTGGIGVNFGFAHLNIAVGENMKRHAGFSLDMIF